MYATGGNKLANRPNSLAFSKHNKGPSSPNSNLKNEEMKIDKLFEMKRPHTATKKVLPNLVSLHKQCALKTLQKIHPSVIYPLKYNRELQLDMDCLAANQEQSMFLFINLARTLSIMKIWSSYTRLSDLDSMVKSQREDYKEYVRSAVQQYFLKISIEAKIEP